MTRYRGPYSRREFSCIRKKQSGQIVLDRLGSKFEEVIQRPAYSRKNSYMADKMIWEFIFSSPVSSPFRMRASINRARSKAESLPPVLAAECSHILFISGIEVRMLCMTGSRYSTVAPQLYIASSPQLRNPATRQSSFLHFQVDEDGWLTGMILVVRWVDRTSLYISFTGKLEILPHKFCAFCGVQFRHFVVVKAKHSVKRSID